LAQGINLINKSILSLLENIVFARSNFVENQPRQRYISLQATITIGLIVFGVVASAIVAGIFYLNFSNQVQEDIKLRLRNIADITAVQINPEELVTVDSKADLENKFYIKYQKEFSDIINADNDVINIYTIRQGQDGTIRFYLDAGDPNYIPDPPGAVIYEQPSELLRNTFAAPLGTVVENDIYTDEFGSVISAYTPLYRKDGSLESILAVDMNADTVINARKKIIQQVLIYFGITIPIISLLAWLFGYRLSHQSAVLSLVATQIAQISEGQLQAIPTSSAGNSREAINLIEIFNTMSGKLQNLIQNLEQRVAERTRDLEQANSQNEKRAKQFESIARISNTIASVQNLRELLPLISEVISQYFDFYHVGIFLTDTDNQYAVLSAANSEGGRKMIQRHHQLRIGEQGIVGYVTQTGKPRIALDVGEDINYFTNPELPSTHSEMALPLKAGNEVIGALDIQSTEVGAFTNEDFKTLSTLADQVSLAIQNARLFDQNQKAISEFEAIQRQYLHETWNRLSKEKKLTGYRYSITGAIPLNENTESAESEGETNSHEISVPIVLRGEKIGTLSVQTPKNERIGTDQVDLIKAVAERVALSAENARLFDETIRRAERERIVSDIATKIGTSFRTESILRTTATELSQLLEDADVVINLQAPNKTKKDPE
jgi:GAF domain-containing protein